MYYHILSILMKTNKFEELSIGCLNDVAMYSNQILKSIADHHPKSIRVLGLASLKCDPDEYMLDSLDYRHFESFSNLQVEINFFIVSLFPSYSRRNNVRARRYWVLITITWTMAFFKCCVIACCWRESSFTYTVTTKIIQAPRKKRGFNSRNTGTYCSG